MALLLSKVQGWTTDIKQVFIIGSKSGAERYEFDDEKTAILWYKTNKDYCNEIGLCEPYALQYNKVTCRMNKIENVALSWHDYIVHDLEHTCSQIIVKDSFVFASQPGKFIMTVDTIDIKNEEDLHSAFQDYIDSELNIRAHGVKLVITECVLTSTGLYEVYFDLTFC